MTRHLIRAAITVLALAIIFVRISLGSQDGTVHAELNKLEPSNGECRTYLVLENKSPGDFTALMLDIVIFGSDGIIERRLAVQVAPLPPGKTSLRAFELGDLPCERVGRLLLNDVMDCADGTGSRDDCLALFTTSTLTLIPFIK